jgi:class 3 adenylate cyclase
VTADEPIHGHVDALEDERLSGLLRRLGATDEELAEARASRSAGDLALELVLRDGHPPLSIQEAADASGLDVEGFTRFWRALGFATAPGLQDRIPADLVAALPIVSLGTTELLGVEVSLGIARVVGTTTARIAEAIVDAFRMQFEVPELTAGASYSDVVTRYVDITRDSLPAFESLISAVLKAHLVRVASGAWAPDEGSQATRRNLFVGFADLVGYTSLSRTLSPGDLAGLLGGFEDAVSDVVTAGGGRLVKLIGDGAMFVADSVDAGCAIALGLSDRLADSELVPAARVGADCGSVLSLSGDYFGEVVNRAARLVALANPSTVVVSQAIADLAERSFTFERLPPQALKGFHAPAVTYRLLGR